MKKRKPKKQPINEPDGDYMSIETPNCVFCLHGGLDGHTGHVHSHGLVVAAGYHDTCLAKNEKHGTECEAYTGGCFGPWTRAMGANCK